MLTADQLDALTDPILELYRQFEDSVIRDIARRLAGMDMTPLRGVTATAAWQAQRLSESGMLFDDILKRLAELTHRSEAELRRTFEQAGVRAMCFDDLIYRAAGLNPLPLNLSPAMAQTLAAGLRKTNGILRNLTMSTASSGQNAFIEAADLAYMQVSSGAMSYTQAIREAVINVADQGLTIINYASGRREQLDVAMRRAVLTGINQTAGNLQITRADEMGVDLVQTSAHVGARNKGVGPANHEGWQGKIFSRSGTHRDYPGFIVSTGYGTGEGLCGWNCRHSFYPFFEGISENAYSQAELDDYAKKTVQYNSETISMYDATQKQRYIERKIRHWKRQEGALKAAGLDATEETARVREWQAQMRDFTKQTGLIRQGERERIGYTPDLTKSAAKIEFRSKEHQRVIDLGDVRRFYQPDDPGINYAVPRPVIYNEFASRHLLSDATHRARIPWLERNYDGFVRAISSPDIIESQLRLRKDGFYSATHIVDLGVSVAEKERFLVVAISLSKNTASGYHQITTIHPKAWRDIFKSDGTLRERYLRAK